MSFRGSFEVGGNGSGKEIAELTEHLIKIFTKQDYSCTTTAEREIVSDVEEKP